MSGTAEEAQGASEGERLLRGLAAVGEAPLPIAEAALALASRERPRVALDRYRDHLARLAEDVADACPEAGAVAERAAALNAVIRGTHGYDGDRLNYDDLQNANLIRVIDRRRGLPVALGILYIHAARAQGWAISGLAFPGHFLLRLDAGGERAILDPFDAGRVHVAAGLRELRKATGGPGAELDPADYAPVADRDILLRLQNNIRIRLIRAGAARPALKVLEGMLLLAPDRAELWHDAAALNAALGNIRAAIVALEELLARERRPAVRQSAAALLDQLRTKLN